MVLIKFMNKKQFEIYTNEFFVERSEITSWLPFDYYFGDLYLFTVDTLDTFFLSSQLSHRIDFIVFGMEFVDFLTIYFFSIFIEFIILIFRLLVIVVPLLLAVAFMTLGERKIIGATQLRKVLMLLVYLGFYNQ